MFCCITFVNVYSSDPANNACWPVHSEEGTSIVACDKFAGRGLQKSMWPCSSEEKKVWPQADSHPLELKHWM